MSSEEEMLLGHGRRGSFSDFDLVGGVRESRCGCSPPKDEDGCVLCCSELRLRIPSWSLILCALLGGAAFAFYPSGSPAPGPTDGVLPRSPGDGSYQPGPAELLENIPPPAAVLPPPAQRPAFPAPPPQAQAAAKPVTLQPTPGPHMPVAAVTLQPTPGPHMPVTAVTLQPTPGPHEPVKVVTLQPTPGPHMPVVKDTLQPTPGPHMPVPEPQAAPAPEPAPPQVHKGPAGSATRLAGLRDASGRRYRNYVLSYQEFDTAACPSGAVLETKINGQIETKCIDLNTPTPLLPGPGEYSNNFDGQWCIAVGGKQGQIRLEVDVQMMELEPGFDRFYIIHNDQLSNAFFGSDRSKIHERVKNLVVPAGEKGHLCTALSTDESEQGRLSFTLAAKEFSGELQRMPCWINEEAQRHEKYPCGVGIQTVKALCPEADSGCEAFDYKAWCFRDKLCGRDREPKVCTKEIASTSEKCRMEGWGLKDASDPDLWKVIYAKNEKFNLDTILQQLKKARQDLLDYWKTHVPNPEELLARGTAINAHEDNATRMLGGRLVRSLLLGDRFTIGFTGSSNTAGHQNTFEATYPIQLQSMLRPVWASIGYKGAAFQSRNHAHGGHISTMDQAWMQAGMVGEDVDVVFWESVMNDGGMFRSDKGGEIALRQALMLAKHPFYMGLDATHHATSETGMPSQFQQMQANYLDRGFMIFRPTSGTQQIQDAYGEGNNDRFFLYASWHPGPQGHRLYGSCIAWEYLKSAIGVLETNMAKFKEAAPDGVPTPALEDVFTDLKIFSSPELNEPTKDMNNPEYLKIDVLAWTLTTMEPIEGEAYLDNYIVDIGGFERSRDGDPEVGDGGDMAMCRMAGGKESCDNKARYKGKKGAAPLKLKVFVQQKLLWFQHAYFSNRLVQAGPEKSSVLPDPKEWHIVINGKDYDCFEGDKVPRVNSKNILNDKDWAGEGGCIIETGPGKFVLEIHTDRLKPEHLIYFDTVVTL